MQIHVDSKGKVALDENTCPVVKVRGGGARREFSPLLPFEPTAIV